MPDEIAHTPEVEQSPAQKDLRAELATDLKSAFTANLSVAGTLPKAACASLVALLGSRSQCAADVIAALGLEDPTQPDASNA